ncbi:hypothetical protein PHET_03201 [Paragonimus heterotremus]|uniref:Uncharacterized protein n=1 Tax=Paragonimus heterotremus TaxID=100268 RepID=A0A8J4WT31_9TREM|nr:hypothetical protein PHET_03201 [Paragonimus heterotremus]
MQYAMEPAATSGYLSNGDTTMESINLAHMENPQWKSHLQDAHGGTHPGTRRTNESTPYSGTVPRIGSVSSGSVLGPGNGVPGVDTGTLTAQGIIPASTGTVARSGTYRTRSKSIDFKPSGKLVDCTVIMLDGTTREFRLDRAAYGQQLFESVCAHLGLMEVEYFGITYYDLTNNWFWLSLDQKIAKQLGKNAWQFGFQVRFYPYDIDAIKEDLTRYYLCLQVRQDIVSGQLPCSFMTYCLLGAYIVQSEAGDHDPSLHVGIQYIQDHPLAPHALQTVEMLERIVQLHKLHRGKSPEEARRLFLNNARLLALYGVDLHKVKNYQNKDVNLGVYHDGILLYRNRVRLMRISWPAIDKLRHQRQHFVVTVKNKGDKSHTDHKLTFKCVNDMAATRLFNVCVEHHAFFRLRGLGEPKKRSLLPAFPVRRYQDSSSSMLNSPPIYPSGNGVSRPLSNFRPVAAHPKDTSWFTLAGRGMDGHMNGAIASQYQYQPSMYNRDVNNMNPIYLDGQQIMANGHPIPGAQGTQRYLPPGVTIPSSVGNVPSALATVPRPTFEAEHWRISPADRTAGLGIDTRGLDVAAQSGAGWQGCRANKGIKAPGAYYFEAACLEDGLVRIGWSTNEASLELGADNCGFGFGSDAVGATGASGAGRAMHRNAGHDYGVPVHQSDVIGCLLDLDKGSVSWSCNGKVFPRGFTIPDQLRGESFFPAASLKDSRILFNFGDQALEFHPGGPFVPVAQAPDDSEVPNRNIGWRLNPYDASAGLDVAPDGSMVQAQLAQGWQGCRANQGIRGPGRFYFEITPLEQIGLCRVGWSTEEANLNLGTDWFGFGYGADNEGFGLNGQQGKRMHNDEIENYGEAFTKDDVIGCFLDTIEHTIKWSKNGIDFEDAYHISTDPSTIPAGIATYFPAISLLNSTVEFNFGYKPFQYYPGPDWTPVCCAPAEYVKRTRRKGPERKVKGWSYIDPAALEPALRQQLKLGQGPMGTARSVERREEDVLHSVIDSGPTTQSSSPNVYPPRQLPPGAIPMPGMVGPSISPIGYPHKHNWNGCPSPSAAGLVTTTTEAIPSPSAHSLTSPLSSTPSAQSPTPAINGSSHQRHMQAPIYDLRDTTRRVLNEGVVVSESVKHSEPQVETESYVDERGKLIKRTIKRSEATTTKTVVERIIASDLETPLQSNGRCSTADNFDLALDAAVGEVTKLDRDTSVLSDSCGLKCISSQSRLLPTELFVVSAYCTVVDRHTIYRCLTRF